MRARSSTKAAAVCCGFLLMTWYLFARDPRNRTSMLVGGGDSKHDNVIQSLNAVSMSLSSVRTTPPEVVVEGRRADLVLGGTEMPPRVVVAPPRVPVPPRSVAPSSLRLDPTEAASMPRANAATPRATRMQPLSDTTTAAQLLAAAKPTLLHSTTPRQLDEPPAAVTVSPRHAIQTTSQPPVQHTTKIVLAARTAVVQRTPGTKPTTRTAPPPMVPTLPAIPATPRADISTVSPTEPAKTCASVLRSDGAECNTTSGEVCIDTAIGPFCVHGARNAGQPESAVTPASTSKHAAPQLPALRRSRGRSPARVIDTADHARLAPPPLAATTPPLPPGPGRRTNRTAASIQRRTPGINASRGVRYGCASKKRAYQGFCRPEWSACCPGMPGDATVCSDPDCNTHRKPGRPCLGIFMQLECPHICGLCDNHDLVRPTSVQAEITSVERDSKSEFERLQTTFRGVLPAVRLGPPPPFGDAHQAMSARSKLWDDEWANTVVFVTVSIGFLDFFQNWKLTAERAGVRRFLVIAEDAAAYSQLKTLVPTMTVFFPHANASAASEGQGKADLGNPDGKAALPYASRAYKSLVNRRPLYIRALLSLGLNVVYTDIDTVWMRSPFASFTGDHTLWIQSDMIKPSDYRFHSLCTGFMAIKPTVGTIQLMLEWEHALAAGWRGNTQHGNQFIFNTVVWRHIRLEQVSVNPLEPKLFPSGALSYMYPQWTSEQNATPVIIHNNYMVGREKKRAVFVSHGLWYIDT
eukprot:m.15733 g.15733  ORF g.15733 m.15733 type:complete len:750 (+) comp8765_c0_seq1:71-2320(+)